MQTKALALLFASMLALAAATTTGSCPSFRQKDQELADELEALVRRIYRDFETLNYADLRTILADDVELCVKAQFDLGCYHGLEAVISYVSLLTVEVAELLQLWAMTPEKTNRVAVYTDIIERAATTTARWEFFSFPAHKNVTLHMHDSFVFNCDNKLSKYTSWGAVNEWADAQIPPVSDYNATRICLGSHLTGVQDVCTGVNQQFATDADCITFMNSIPHEVEGFGFGLGNSLGCRDWHLGLARFNPSIHCPHVGISGGGKCTNEPVF